MKNGPVTEHSWHTCPGCLVIGHMLLGVVLVLAMVTAAYVFRLAFA